MGRRFYTNSMPAQTANDPSGSGLSLAVRLHQDRSAAWRELVELYGPLVRQWIMRCGLDGATSEDICQDVFLSVHRSIDGFRPDGPGATFRGWLWRITRNAVAAHGRRLARDDGLHVGRGGSTAVRQIHAVVDSIDATDVSSGSAKASFGSGDPSPSTAGDTAALLHRALEQIRDRVHPTTYRAFVAVVIEGRSPEETATELGITPASVRQAKCRMLQRLRKQLGDLG